MQEGELAAAIVAGDLGGISEAYDRYGASLYAYCHFMLSSPEAAVGAVLDTFATAMVRLDGLRDPSRLGPWLHAVARKECLRRLDAAGGTPPAGTAGPLEAEGAVALPEGLREQVIAVCTDASPTGRAYRASVVHRAGAFGPTGFPRAAGPAGPRWWQPVRRHPRVAAAAIAAVLVLAAGTGAFAALSGPGQARPVTVGLGDGLTGTPGGPSGHASAPSSPGRKTLDATHPTATPAAGLAGTPSPAAAGNGGLAKPGAKTPLSGAATVSLSPSAASPSPSASTAPGQGYLLVSPSKLVLTGLKTGKAVSGTFILTALNGPVTNFTVTVPKAMAAKVKVSPAKGSLVADGWVTITVTVTSKVALSTHLTVNPGGIAVTIGLVVKV